MNRPTGGGGEGGGRGGTRPSVRRSAIGACLALAASLVVACGGNSGPPTINWYAQKQSQPAFNTVASYCTQQAHGRYKINLVDLPADTDEARQQLTRRLAAHDSSIDLMAMDVIWTGEFANAGWIMPWSGADHRKVKATSLDAPLATGTFRNQMYAAPLNTNTQLLWYRKDLVKTPPKTWDEMIRAADALAKAGKPHYIEVQANRYEGYIVWFTSLLASAGGSVINVKDQSVALPTRPTVKALTIIKKLATSAAADPQITTAKEDTTSVAWDAGQAAFMVNYPFVYSTAQAEGVKLKVGGKPSSVYDQMGYAPYPAVVPGRPGRVTVGGFNLGISSYSQHQDLAFDAARCLRSNASQLKILDGLGLPPSTASLYETKTAKKDMPYRDAVLKTLKAAVSRPQTPSYGDITLAMLRVLHPPGNINPQKDVKKLRDNVANALKGKGLY